MLKYPQNWGNDSRQQRQEREDPQVTYQQGSMAYEKMYLTPLNSASRDTLHEILHTNPVSLKRSCGGQAACERRQCSAAKARFESRACRVHQS